VANALLPAAQKTPPCEEYIARSTTIRAAGVPTLSTMAPNRRPSDSGNSALSRPPETEEGLWRLDIATGVATRLRSWHRVSFFGFVGSRLVYLQDSGRSQIHSVAFE
jgi:hypothetical protein